MSAPRPDIDGIFLPDKAVCELCGEPMPAGEEMFQFHGYSGPCPKPPTSAPRPEGMSEDDWKRLPSEIQLQRLADSAGKIRGADHEVGGFFTRQQARELIAELDRLRADGATLPPAEWLRAFDALLRQHGIPDGLIVRDFTAWAARVMKGARVGMDEALAAHSASFGALQILSAALFDGEVDDYAALAEKIIARVKQAEADGATLLQERDQLREANLRYAEFDSCACCEYEWDAPSDQPDIRRRNMVCEQCWNGQKALIRAEQAETIATAAKAEIDRLVARCAMLEADGATLRERVKKLPSPVTPIGAYLQDRRCEWCDARWPNKLTHPDNGCLWSDVHKDAK